MSTLKDKVIIVTGGSGGIGRATALAMASEGAKIVIADILVGEGHETVDMIRKTGREAFFRKTDVSSSAEVEELITETIGRYGRLDCAFNNAGIEGDTSYTIDYSEETWDRVMRINLKSIWLCMKYEIPQMLRQKSGAIVNTASMVGLIGRQQMCAYAASKAGVILLTRTTALEYALQGIRVNAVCPGGIRTDMVTRRIAKIPNFEETVTKKIPMGRMGRPEEIAGAVVWLCSDAASFVTGQTMVVDGGQLAE